MRVIQQVGREGRHTWRSYSSKRFPVGLKDPERSLTGAPAYRRMAGIRSLSTEEAHEMKRDD